MIILALVLFVYGLCNTFFGYKLYRFWICFNGFCIGALVGAVLGAISGEGVIAFCGACLVGALGAWLSHILWKVGVFIQCFIYGFLGAFIPLLLGQLPSSGADVVNMGVNVIFGGTLGFDLELPIIMGLILGILLGILGLFFTRVIIIFTSAFTGSAAYALGMYLVLGGAGRFVVSLILLSTIALMVTGVIVQLKTTGNRAGKEIVQGKRETPKEVDFQCVKKIEEDRARNEMTEMERGISADIQEMGNAFAETSHKVFRGAIERISKGTETAIQKIEKSLLPYAREIAGIIAILFGLLGCLGAKDYGIVIGIFYGLSEAAPILMIICGISMIKKEYVTCIVILAGEVVVSLFISFFNWSLRLGVYTEILKLACYVLLIYMGCRYAKGNHEKISVPVNEKLVEKKKLFCTQCGLEIKENAKFCTRCGKERMSDFYR